MAIGAKFIDVIPSSVENAADVKKEDVKNYLQGLFENGNLDEEKYEELVDSEEFLQKAVELFDKMEDCNTPFNTTMELAVGEARKEMTI